MNDLINREDAIKAIVDSKFVIEPQLIPLYNRLGFMDRMADYNDTCDMIVKILKTLPSMQGRPEE